MFISVISFGGGHSPSFEQDIEQAGKGGMKRGNSEASNGAHQG